MPFWLTTPGLVLLRKFVRTSKSNPLAEEVDLKSAIFHYVYIRLPDGRQTTVSTKNLAPTTISPTINQDDRTKITQDLISSEKPTSFSEEMTTDRDIRTTPGANDPVPCSAPDSLWLLEDRVIPHKCSNRVNKPLYRLGY